MTLTKLILSQVCYILDHFMRTCFSYLFFYLHEFKTILCHGVSFIGLIISQGSVEIYFRFLAEWFTCSSNDLLPWFIR